MKTIVTAHTVSKARPAAFFESWADMATWPAWNSDTEWARLDGPFAQGTTGVIKPKGGPEVKFVIEELVPEKKYVDVSRLFGARLVFDHEVSVDERGKTVVDVTVSLYGPMTWFWMLVLGKGLKESAQRDLDSLVAMVGRP